MIQECKMYAKLKHLHAEGFYLFAISYLEPKQTGWIEYSREKTVSSIDTQEKRFTNISQKEYDKCFDLFHTIA